MALPSCARSRTSACAVSWSGSAPAKDRPTRRSNTVAPTMPIVAALAPSRCSNRAGCAWRVAANLACATCTGARSNGPPARGDAERKQGFSLFVAATDRTASLPGAAPTPSRSSRASLPPASAFAAALDRRARSRSCSTCAVGRSSRPRAWSTRSWRARFWRRCPSPPRRTYAASVSRAWRCFGSGGRSPTRIYTSRAFAGASASSRRAACSSFGSAWARLICWVGPRAASCRGRCISSRTHASCGF